MFESPAALDDFLIEKQEFESKFGDIVFSRGKPFLRTKDIIENQILPKANNLESLMAEARQRSTSAVYDDDEVLEYRRPYVGVNRFLSGLKPNGSDLLFPEFRLEEEYWPRRINEWTRPLDGSEKVSDRFTDDEIDIFFNGNSHEEKKQNARLLNQEEAKQLKKLMSQKWKFQANAGTTIHYVLQQYFTKNENGILNGESEGFFEFVKNNIQKDIINSGIKWNDGLINDTVINQLITYAGKLKEQFRKKYGKDCEFYPELKISHQLSKLKEGEPDILFGIIDLAIIDKKGQIHYFDYKSSPKDYSKFDVAKKRTYTYQLAMYGKLLRKYGLDYRNSDIGILPIQFQNLQLANSDEAHSDPNKAQFKYTDITYPIDGTGNIEIETDIQKSIFGMNSSGEQPVLDVLDDYLPEELILDAPSEDIIQNVNDQISTWFPNYKQFKAKSDEEIKEMLEKADALTPQLRNGKNVWVFKPKGAYTKEITADSQFELVEKIKKQQIRWEKSKEWMAKTVIKALKIATEPNGTIEDARQYLSSVDTKGIYEKEGLANWFIDTLAKYCNGNWEVIEHDSLKHFGIILLRNKVTKQQIDVVKMSSSNLYYNPFSGKNTMLTSAFQNDISESSNQNSLMLQGYVGNIELIETMLALNNIPQLFMGEYSSAVIGDIQIINSFRGDGISAQNEELLYSFNKLNQLSELKTKNNISEGIVKFGTAFELATTAFEEAMISSSSFVLKESQFNSAKSKLDESIDGDIEDKKKAIKDIIYRLENTSGYEYLKAGLTKDLLLNKPEARLYYKMLNALANLNGITYKQQIKDHDKWLQERTFSGILQRGISGTYLDNPGNLLSDALNSVAKLVTQAYQNIRNSMSSKVAKIRKATEELKISKGYTGLTQLGGNATDMYKNMTKVVNGDLMFTDINDPELTVPEKNYLKLILEIINENRFGGKYTKEQLEAMRDSYEPQYYRVPLAIASSESRDSEIGLTDGLMERFRRFNPKNALAEMRAAVEGIFDENDDSYKSSEFLFTMNNMFDRTEGKIKNRLDAIEKNGAGFFERNLEVLAFKHTYAYESAKQLNEVFPMMKAAMGFLANAGNTVNDNFKNDTEYLINYIKNSVKGQPIQKGEKMEKATLVAGKIKQIASFMALSFSPVQGMYQTIQGLWQDISLIIRKPDGTNAFTIKNMYEAAKEVYKDLFHYHTAPTKCQLINEWLGVNDMDMNLYAERMRTDQYNKYNFTNFAFKFASRPDFYNRMTIIIAKMKADGIWDALEVKDGQLIYNYKKDKRFEVFANNHQTSNPKYQEQQALYYTIAKQFINEGVYNPDGTKFEIGQPLPYAWTNQEAESVKSLCDLIYGYYSHEKKSLIHATFLGSLYMQMKTYWSGKKNQYLAPGGVRIQGKWVHAVDSEKNLLYYQLNNDGTINYNEPPTTTNTGYAFYQWKGQWQEGVILTLANIFRNGISREGLKKGWNDTWNNEDENISTIRRSNIKQFGTDIMFYGLIGLLFAGFFMADWDKDMQKKAKETNTLSDALKATAVHVTRVSLGQSADDFNWAATIGNPAVNWSPFSFTQFTNVGKRVGNLIIGDHDFYNGVVNSFATGKQLKPLMEYIKTQTE